MRTSRRRPGGPGEGAARAPEYLGAFEEKLLCELKLVVAEHATTAREPARAPDGAAPAPLDTRGVPARLRGAGLASALRTAFPARGARVTSAARPARPLGRAAIAAALGVAMAAGLAAGVTAVAGGGRGSGHTPVSPARRHGTLVADFLDRAAAAVLARPGPAYRPGQVYYANEFAKGHGNFADDNYRACNILEMPSPDTGGPMYVVTASGRTATACAHLRPASRPPVSGHRVSKLWLHYRWAVRAYPPPGSLPADPAALRAALERAASRDNRGGVNFYDNLDQDYVPGHPAATRKVIFFTLVSRLLMSPIAGRLRAGLYQMIAGMPNIKLVPHVKDAAGRSGTEVQITVPEWRLTRKQMIECRPCDSIGYGPDVEGFILDPHTYRYLGYVDTQTSVYEKGSSLTKSYTDVGHDIGAVVRSGFLTPQPG